MRIVIKDGLLWQEKVGPLENIIGTITADKIAQVNGDPWVERFIGRYPEGTILYLDDGFKIKDGQL